MVAVDQSTGSEQLTGAVDGKIDLSSGSEQWLGAVDEQWLGALDGNSG